MAAAAILNLLFLFIFTQAATAFSAA